MRNYSYIFTSAKQLSSKFYDLDKRGSQPKFASFAAQCKVIKHLSSYGAWLWGLTENSVCLILDTIANWKPCVLILWVEGVVFAWILKRR